MVLERVSLRTSFGNRVHGSPLCFWTRAHRKFMIIQCNSDVTILLPHVRTDGSFNGMMIFISFHINAQADVPVSDLQGLLLLQRL